MGKIVYGLGNTSVTLNFTDHVVRATQASILQRLLGGQGVFLRAGGSSGDGQTSHHSVLWISSGTPIAFLYDGNVHPAPDKELVDIFSGMIDEAGGISLPGLDYQEDPDEPIEVEDEFVSEA